MNYELISDEQYNALPDDDEQCFAEFEAICRRNMTRMIDENTDNAFDRAVQTQYMTAVSAVGAECGIFNLEIKPFKEEEFHQVYSRFSLAVQGEVARIRIRGRGSRHPFSVQLAPNTRIKIEHHISRIRETVEASDIPAGRKKALGGKLDLFVAELGGHRVSFAKTMAILSAVLVGLGSGTTIAAEGPAAVTNIMRLIGIDKETEEAATSRLAPPPKALPAPQATPVTAPRNGPSTLAAADALDEEIPF